MINVDMKNLILRLNDFCTTVLQTAAGFCVSRTQYEVSVEHFLQKILHENRSDLFLILTHFGLDFGKVERALEENIDNFKTGNTGKPVFSMILLNLFQEAWIFSSIDLEEDRIRSGAILQALLTHPAQFTTGTFLEMLKKINKETLKNDFWTIVKGSVESLAAQKGVPGKAPSGKPVKTGFIDKFCNDFTQKAQDGQIDPVFGRDKEIRLIIDILARRRKNNPICVGEPGVGKTAVVEGLALRIIEEDVPDVLANVRLLELDIGLLEAGAGVKGEFENRLKGVISEVKSSEKPVIMFIDEAHTRIGAGASAGGGDAANLLKPALARGELRTVAATTWKEFKKYFEKDPALARRFQPVKLDEPSVENTELILRGIKPNYEDSHKVIIRDDALKAAAELSDRFITGRFLPDKAIDLLDTSCARIKINLTTKPAVLEDKERKIQALEREKKGMERDRDNLIEIEEDKLKQVNKDIKSITSEANKVKERWLKEKEAAGKILEIRKNLQNMETDGDKKKLKKSLDKADKAFKKTQGEDPLIQVEVNPEIVAQVIADWTGIPVGKVLKDEAASIIVLADNLKSRVKGQDHAIEEIVSVIKTAKTGIKNPNQPLGVFLLVGPSGVGKTELGLSIADSMFGSERNAVIINMSEFQEGHTVSRLIGSPPGYVGYGEGGMLSEAVRQKPYSVVLLDEVEKAHLDVMNLFYQVFDKGTLTDGEGKEIDFKNTVMILTSNIGTEIIQNMSVGEEMPPVENVSGAIRPLLSKHFKPALLARMTVIPFYSLNVEAMKPIVKLKLDKVVKLLLDNNKIEMKYTDKVIDQIAGRCTEVETGARNIDFILNGNVLPMLAQKILTTMSEGNMPSHVNLGISKSGEFTTKFRF